ncbi:MAG: hypothetical protein ABI818_02445 [Acidobacteriota bacterium]
MKQPSAIRRAMPQDWSAEARLADQISAAPELLRSYIRTLERQGDPGRNLQELVYAREEKKMLAAAIVELEDTIRARDADQNPTGD